MAPTTDELAAKRYGPLVSHFTFYAAYHNNKVNQLIHIVVSLFPKPGVELHPAVRIRGCLTSTPTP